MTLAALKPCPFCGGDKIIVSQTLDQQGPNWYATCHRATCAFTGYSSTKAEAIAAWNTRTGQLVPVPSVERVARLIADELGDNYDDVPADKREWIKTRGQFRGVFRDVNQPFRCDYDAAATAVIAAMKEGRE